MVRYIHLSYENMEKYHIYKEVDSDLNTKRKGLWQLLKDAKTNRISTIFVNYKDRLTGFGYKYLENYLSEFGVKLVYLNKLSNKYPESEMVEDLVAIIHSFSGKLYGLRSGKNREKDKKNCSIS